MEVCSLAGYNFKLERVLNYKEKLEDIKKARFADSTNKLNKEEEKLLYFNTYKENLLEKQKAKKNTSIGYYKLYNNYLNDLSAMIKNQEKVVEDAKEDLNKAKEELLTAMQERKSFEKLKEIQYEEYLIDAKKEEEKLIDGIITFNVNTRQ